MSNITSSETHPTCTYCGGPVYMRRACSAVGEVEVKYPGAQSTYIYDFGPTFVHFCCSDCMVTFVFENGDRQTLFDDPKGEE